MHPPRSLRQSIDVKSGAAAVNVWQVLSVRLRILTDCSGVVQVVSNRSIFRLQGSTHGEPLLSRTSSTPCCERISFGNSFGFKATRFLTRVLIAVHHPFAALTSGAHCCFGRCCCLRLPARGPLMDARGSDAEHWANTGIDTRHRHKASACSRQDSATGRSIFSHSIIIFIYKMNSMVAGLLIFPIEY